MRVPIRRSLSSQTMILSMLVSIAVHRAVSTYAMSSDMPRYVRVLRVYTRHEANVITVMQVLTIVSTHSKKMIICLQALSLLAQ